MSAAEAAVFRGRAAAEELMVDACVVASPAVRSDDGAVITPGLVRYVGRCRLQEAAVPGAQQGTGTAVARPPAVDQVKVLSLPVSAVAVRVGDAVEMTSSALDPTVAGLLLRVTGVSGKSHLTARRLECEMVDALPFGADEVTVVTPPLAADPYGNLLPDWPSATRVTVLGMVRALPGREDRDARDQVRDDYRVWLPAGTTVTALARLEWAGLVLDVDGEPRRLRDTSTALPVEVDAFRVRG